MSRDINNKVVVVTGAAQGIGFQIATHFLDKKAKHIILLDINEEGKEAARTLNNKYGADKADFIKCDVTTDLEKVSKKIFDTYKTVDVVVNNAGIAGGFSATNDIYNKKTLDINVTALTLWSMKFWEHMRKDKGGIGGTIINLGSIYGLKINHFIPVYVASKFAVVGFSKSLGHPYNYSRSGVRVIVLCPGYTESNLTTNPDRYFEEQQLQEDFMKYIKDKIWQKADAVGRGAVQVFEVAESGTSWLIDAGKPAVEV